MRAYFIELVLVAMLVLAVAFFGYLGYGLLQADVGDDEFSGEAALRYATQQVDFGPRPITTAANLATEEWLITELTQSQWTVAVQPYIANLDAEVTGSDVISGTVNAAGQYTILAHNIVAVSEPAGADLPVGLLIAHYDSRVVADEDGNPDARTTPGVDANGAASGAAVLLELARTLNVANTRHRLCLVLLNGEGNRELDGWGTTHGGDYFLKGLRDGNVPDCANPRFAVVLDLVGGENQQIYVEANSDHALSTALWSTAVSLNYADSIIPEVKWPAVGPHLALNRAGIPTAMLVDYDYPYRRTTQDTADKLDAESLARVGRVLSIWLEQGAPFGP